MQSNFPRHSTPVNSRGVSHHSQDLKHQEHDYKQKSSTPAKFKPDMSTRNVNTSNPIQTKTSSAKSAAPLKDGNSSQSNLSKSFNVDNESSLYAFEAEPSSKSQPQLPFRKSGQSSSSHPIPSKNKHENKSQNRKTSSASNLGLFTTFGGNEGLASMGSSIPIPDELAAQLVEQAAAEGAPSGTETTYFIPLSTGTGQSFGVAVKIGTEGPPGPNQKVIMKAKLVTQPVGKTVGARVIGARTTAIGESSNMSSSQINSDKQKVETPFKRMPMASPAYRRSSR